MNTIEKLRELYKAYHDKLHNGDQCVSEYEEVCDATLDVLPDLLAVAEAVSTVRRGECWMCDYLDSPAMQRPHKPDCPLARLTREIKP